MFQKFSEIKASDISETFFAIHNSIKKINNELCLLVICFIRNNIKEKLEQKFLTFQNKKTDDEAASFFV